MARCRCGSFSVRQLLFAAALLLCGVSAHAAASYSFGVLSQRSPVLTAEYWNPILAYVSRKSGVRLELKVTRTAPESNAAIHRGAYDFAYSNHLFKPANRAPGYRVILQPRAGAIRGQIVTLEASPIRSLAELNGRTVGFPSPSAFVGYEVPMDRLLRQGIAVIPAFGGNQEGIMGQLEAGKVIAAGVNDRVMRDFAARRGFRYRVLWQSDTYAKLPIAVLPRVPAAVGAAVRDAFAGMAADPKGLRVLEASAAIIRQKPPLGFRASSDRDYLNYLSFYKTTLLKDIE